MHVLPYLTFNGNCREAMTFYRDCLGGELQLQTIGESPLSGQLPAKMKNNILHAVLRSDALVIMASDMTPDSGRSSGNQVSLMLECDSAEMLHQLYEQLASGGSRDHAVEQTFWGALLGGLTDRFGNHWLLHYSQYKTSTK